MNNDSKMPTSAFFHENLDFSQKISHLSDGAKIFVQIYSICMKFGETVLLYKSLEIKVRVADKNTYVSTFRQIKQ